MQFGIFSVSDITTDPTTGRTPTEAERIKAILTIAEKAEARIRPMITDRTQVQVRSA